MSCIRQPAQQVAVELAHRARQLAELELHAPHAQPHDAPALPQAAAADEQLEQLHVALGPVVAVVEAEALPREVALAATALEARHRLGPAAGPVAAAADVEAWQRIPVHAAAPV